MNKKEIWEELDKSGFTIGLRLSQFVKPIITEDMDEEKTLLYFLTIDEIPALQGLLNTLEMGCITLKNEIEKRKINIK